MVANVQDKVKCPHCGQMTGTETGFCDECGLELASQAIKPVTAAQAMASGTLKFNANEGSVCPNCGAALRPNARHCPNCGKKLTVAAAPAASTATASMVAQSKNGPPSVLQAGLIVADRYGLESILGEGGMGRVWKAYDRHLNKYVVIKTVLTPDDGLRKALQKEAEVLINIRHPNIVAVIDFFTVDNELCYVMEFVSGPSWADEIEDAVSRKLVQPMSAEQALIRVKGLLPAFRYLHGLRPPIIYCDFKPANVKSMELPNGETVQVLLDFGTAYLYDPQVPPKPARGTPGYHSPNAAHPDWRDDYFTIGRTLAELVGMGEIHTEQYKYTLTPPTDYPWTQYDDSFRFFVEWLTAYNRDDRPQSVDEIMAELDGVLGYVKGQKPDRALAPIRSTAQFTKATVAMSAPTTGTLSGTGTVKIDLPQVEATNPAATILLSAQEAYEQRNMTRALQLTNQAVNNNGGAAAFVLRSLINNQLGDTAAAQSDIQAAQKLSDPQVQWQMALAEGQLYENSGHFDQAAERYRRMMAIKPGDHRGRLLLADLYRRNGNNEQAIGEYKAIIQAKPNVGQAYIGASKAYLSSGGLENAIKVLEDVSSRNTSYNDVMLELIDLYNQKALQGSAENLDQASRAIGVLRENGVESKQFYRLMAEFYYTALKLARKSGTLPAIAWPNSQQIKTIPQLAAINEKAWRDYLARDPAAKRNDIINQRIMAERAWSLV